MNECLQLISLLPLRKVLRDSLSDLRASVVKNENFYEAEIHIDQKSLLLFFHYLIVKSRDFQKEKT